MLHQEPTNGPSAPRFVPPTFHCAGIPCVGGVQVHAAGDLDLASAPVLREVLRDAQSSARLVVLDLQALTFIDSAGLHLLRDTAFEAQKHGGRLVLTRVPPHTVRVLELCGFTSTLKGLDVQPARDVEQVYA